MVLAAAFAACSVDTEGTGAATNPVDGGGTGGTGFDGGTGGTGAAGTGGTSGSGGSCFPASDEKLCGDTCPKKTDPAFGCGSSSCAPCEFPNATATCAGGQCVIAGCNVGFEDCDGDPLNGCETNLQADPTNCSTCGNDCNTAGGAKAWACNAGTCQVTLCDQGFGDCNKNPADKCEVDFENDANNCGFCGNVCNLLHASAKCVAGLCVVDSCDPGWKNCDTANPTACEQDIATDANNCGDCGTKCNTTNGSATCVGSACQIACQGGFGDCNSSASDGCETNLNTSAAHCGACNTPCSGNHGTASCSGGNCSISCASGFKDCDTNPRANGCEVDSQTDNNHCGACTTKCTGGQTCKTGACACAAGQVFFNGSCCTPKTCSQLGKNCGSVSDTCGGTLSCGTCTSPETCAGGGTPNVCGCTAEPQSTTCSGNKCGTFKNNCNLNVNCSCGSGDVCNGGTCCTPKTCAADYSGQCGSKSDGCGGNLNCTCGSGQTCNSGTCCTPKTCAADYSGQCGSLSNGCGGNLTCSCTGTDYCNGSTCASCSSGVTCQGGTQCCSQSGNTCNGTGGACCVPHNGDCSGSGDPCCQGSDSCSGGGTKTCH